MNELKEQYQEIINLIEENNYFLLTAHVSPDGDSIGSILGLYFMLKMLNKNVSMVIEDEVPDFLSFLPESDKIKTYNGEIDGDFDIVFALDCSNKARLGDVAQLIKGERVVNIDHHIDNSYFGDYNLVLDTAATAEIVYDLFNELPALNLNDDLATVIATALITDTGSFRYSNTTSKTHKIMAHLLETGIDTADICQRVFSTKSKESLLLLAKSLDTLQIAEEGVAWVKVSQKILAETGASVEDIEGLVSYPLSLEGIEVAALFKEVASGEIKVSLRSKKFILVNKIADEFDGGGHDRAAGLSMEGQLEKVEQKVIGAIKKELSEQRVNK